ncbi:MAG: hypothetical protein KU38_02335 [Sulfurovum sp. FS08-3]|nr:MAG: hypothetical protein KU38_02335 [Sulfurovum sp. FS08-3]
MMQNFLVAYDIYNPKRLYKVRKLLYSYALSGQKSALEMPLTHILCREMIQQLEPLIENEDRVNVIKIVGKPILLGKAETLEYHKGVIIV